MCDYSLLGISNRLAVEGEPLIVHRFPTRSIGLASTVDLRIPSEKPSDQPPQRWWSALKSWFSPSIEKPVAAVCVPPGARLLLRDIPQRLQQDLSVGPEEEVTFVQLSASEYHYRDAVRFKNGRELLLQRLEEGQRADMLCLSPEEAEAMADVAGSDIPLAVEV
jgi:hypothetical protein